MVQEKSVFSSLVFKMTYVDLSLGSMCVYVCECVCSCACVCVLLTCIHYVCVCGFCLHHQTLAGAWLCTSHFFHSFLWSVLFTKSHG